MEGNALYTDDRLVSLYDRLNRWGADNDFYLGLAGETPIRILDAGCGTGMLAVAYAKAGHDVVGIDPAPKMLDAASARGDGDLVEWRASTLQAYETEESFDLIVMTGHAFQCLITDNDISEAFASISRLLAEDGRFVFETRNPEARLWERWTPERSKTRLSAPDGMAFELFHKVLSVDGEKVTFETRYRFAGQKNAVVSRSTLRFAPFGTIEKLASARDLIVEKVSGDWDCSRLQADSPEIIVTLRRNRNRSEDAK